MQNIKGDAPFEHYQAVWTSFIAPDGRKQLNYKSKGARAFCCNIHPRCWEQKKLSDESWRATGRVFTLRFWQVQLLTVNFPQTESLTFEMHYLYKRNLVFFLSAWYTSWHSWAWDSRVPMPAPALAFCSPAPDVHLVAWAPPFLPLCAHNHILTGSPGPMHSWQPSQKP